MKSATLRHFFEEAPRSQPTLPGAEVRRGRVTKRPRAQDAARPPMVQLFIDAGQRQVDFVTCKDCDMTYANGIPEDEAVHRAYHQSAMARRNATFAFMGWTRERVLARFGPGPIDQRHRVICVRKGDPPPHMRKVQRILDDIALELGNQSSQPLGNAAALLYIVNKSIVGIVIAERIISAIPAVMEAETGSVRIMPDNPEARPAERGIRLVWVNPTFRRQKIATRLVDLARAKFPRSSCAFTTPTESGFQFALHYLQSANNVVPVYRTSQAPSTDGLKG